MSSFPLEQRNPYKGRPERAWFRVQLEALDGSLVDGQVLADTGNPFTIIITLERLKRFKHLDAPPIATNFGVLEGGWLQVRIMATGLYQLVLGYGSDAVVTACQGSSPDFEGLAGLPLLRLGEYGGDAQEFWVRGAAASP